MWATEYKTNNNATDRFPGILNDGRLFTNYMSDAVENNNIKQSNFIKSNTQYREYLTKNALSIMKTNYNSMILENTVPDFDNRIQNGPPVLFKGVQDDSTPYGFEYSFPKNIYLSRERLDDQKRRPMKPNYDI
jgi:hypothetical protein